MRNSQRFFERLRTELKLDIPEDAVSTPTRAGYWQRSLGAWASVITSKSDPLLELGLGRSIAELLKCPNLELIDSHGWSVDCGCPGMCKGLKKKDKVK